MKHTVKPGQRFGKLVVLIPEGNTRSGKTGKWRSGRTCLCKCDCGRLIAPTISLLIRRQRKCRSCITDPANGQKYLEHGCWTCMRDRCNNPNSKDFADYGAKGVTVAPAWDDFTQFRKDVGPRPSKEHSLDRWPNREGNYEPGNVRWATPRQQSINRKPTVWVMLEGQKMYLKEAATFLNFPYEKAKHRRRRGWPPERWFEPVATVTLAA